MNKDYRIRDASRKQMYAKRSKDPELKGPIIFDGTVCPADKECIGKTNIRDVRKKWYQR